jgi:hypothetical protein
MRVAGRSQSIYRTDVKLVAMTAGGPDAYWNARLAQVAPMHPRRVDLKAGTLGVWYSGNRTFPKVLTLEVAKPLDGALLVASREGEAGKESLGESLASDIVNAYVRTTDRGFCVGGGSIMMEPSQNEYSRVALESLRIPQVELRVETQTVREPERSAYANTDEDEEIVRASGGSLETLRNGERLAAELRGHELWIEAAVPGQPTTIRYAWHYPGEAGSSVRPSVTIVASAQPSQRQLLNDVWETVLTSLRPIPPPPPERR